MFDPYSSKETKGKKKKTKKGESSVAPKGKAVEASISQRETWATTVAKEK